VPGTRGEVADSPRIEELRRRLLKDPASIAFAQLAEEHRRGGDLDEAVRVAEAGLEQHPGYLSVRVTLGRALLELGRLDEAAAEFSRVVEAAPDNLIAVRALADIHQRVRKTTDVRRSEAGDEPPAEVPAEVPAEGPTGEPAVVGSPDAVSVTGFASESGPADEPGDEPTGPPPPADPVAAFAAVPDGSMEMPIQHDVADDAPALESAAGPTRADEPAVAPDPLVAELETWLAVFADRRHA